jgi:hypothetical protein
MSIESIVPVRSTTTSTGMRATERKLLPARTVSRFRFFGVQGYDRLGRPTPAIASSTVNVRV